MFQMKYLDLMKMKHLYNSQINMTKRYVNLSVKIPLNQIVLIADIKMTIIQV